MTQYQIRFELHETQNENENFLSQDQLLLQNRINPQAKLRMLNFTC
jgi:hypothetical protein